MSTFNEYCRKAEKKIRLKWRIIFYDGLGLYVFTDNRMVFLRNPIKYETSFKFSGSRFATLSDWEYWTNRSNKALEKSAKEFFEIPYDEIEKVNIGSSTCRIIVNSKKEKFKFTLDADVGNVLQKLQDKDKKIQPIICFENVRNEEYND